MMIQFNNVRCSQMTRFGTLLFAFLPFALVACGGGQQSAGGGTKCTNPVLLSRGSPVTASSGVATAKAVTDGDRNTLWNSGGYPPQWVEIDLGDADVHHVTLIPEQTPAGHTEHHIVGIPASGGPRSLGDLKGDTQSGGEFTVTVAPDLTQRVRKVRIETTQSPRSWVAWREIEVYGCREAR
jgi:hypothetical protein